jgi:hypothetical protein
VNRQYFAHCHLVAVRPQVCYISKLQMDCNQASLAIALAGADLLAIQTLAGRVARRSPRPNEGSKDPRSAGQAPLFTGLAAMTVCNSPSKDLATASGP